jgi:hypothetical protein
MKTFARAVVEIGFIIFLFYSNLLMGEFERSGVGRQKSLAWGLEDVFTMENFLIAIVASGIGYVLVEILRTRLWSDDRRSTTGLFSKAALEKERAGKK